MNDFNDEALRDYIKGMLSSHYENTVTGEMCIRDSSNHALENKLLVAKFFYHGEILFFRNLHRKCQHDAPGKLGVPLVLHGFHGVPEGCPVCKSGQMCIRDRFGTLRKSNRRWTI